jgi:molybdopterin converting factor small subunit
VKVTVRLLATFRDFLPQDAVRSALCVDVDESATVQALLEGLGVPHDLPSIVLVNGRYAAEHSRLTDGDVVSVFPPLIGGRSSPER